MSLLSMGISIETSVSEDHVIYIYNCIHWHKNGCCGEFGVQVLWRYSCVNGGQDGRQSIGTLSRCVVGGNRKHVICSLFGW